MSIEFNPNTIMRFIQNDLLYKDTVPNLLQLCSSGVNPDAAIGVMKGKAIQHNLCLRSRDTNVITSTSQNTLVCLSGTRTFHSEMLLEIEAFRRWFGNVEWTERQSVGSALNSSNESLPATNSLTGSHRHSRRREQQ